MFNTGQMILVLGAMVLFAIVLPSVNSAIFYSDSNQVLTKVENSAISIAQKYLSEAATKKFDEVCMTNRPLVASQLTPTANLGCDAGENYPNFDDVDDYSHFSIVDSTTFPSVPFNVNATVDYVDPNNPSVVSSSQTFIKRLRVTISSSFLVDPASGNSLQIVLERLYAFH
jgi:type II secretory pathway pseudopilin PulG